MRGLVLYRQGWPQTGEVFMDFFMALMQGNLDTVINLIRFF